MSSPGVARRNPFTPPPRCGCEARWQQRRHLVTRANPAHRRWAGAAPAAPSVRLLAVLIGRLDDLRVPPDGVLLAEVEVVVGDLLEGRVLGRLVPEHLEPRLLEGGQVLVAPT